MLIILTLMISVLVCIKDDSHGVSCIMYLMSDVSQAIFGEGKSSIIFDS